MPSTPTRPALSTRLRHLWERRDTPAARHLVKYAMVSIVSTIVSFSVLFVVFGVLKLWGEVVSTVVANAVAAVPAYYLNRMWVWGKGGRSHLTKEVLPFWSLTAIGIFVSIFGAAGAKHIGQVHHLDHLEQTVLVLTANLVSFGVFWVLKFLIFGRIFAIHPLEELDDLVEADDSPVI
jgi:putative flippase GtrA